MAEIRINKLMRQFNIGLSDLVNFLRKQGADVDENPNAKVSDEYLSAIEKQFGKDKDAKEAAEKVDVHLTEILEKSNRKSSKPDEEEDEIVREITIKSNTFLNQKKGEPELETAPAVEPEPVVAHHNQQEGHIFVAS